MKLSRQIKSTIRDHSLKEHPNECCGLIIDNGEEEFAFECKNVSPKKSIRFQIDPLDYSEGSNLGNVIGYYHSHPDDDPENKKFSKTDLLISRAQRLPLIMYYVKGNEFFIYNYKND